MIPHDLARVIVFSASYILLFAGHHTADHLIQGDRTAKCKSLPGREGWSAAAVHVASHVTACALLLLTGRAVLHLPVHPLIAALALGWIGASHGLIDRRWPVEAWMRRTGSADWYASGAGAPVVDQAGHLVVGLLPAALLIGAFA